LAEHKIKAIIFDLGETLLTYGKIKMFHLFKESGELAYAYLHNLNQPVGTFWPYLLRNLIGLRFKYMISAITGNDFDSLEAIKKYGLKKGYNLTEQQWQELNWLWYEPLGKKAHIEENLAETLGKLKAAGMKLGILSNTFVHSSTLDRHLAQEGLIDFFDMRIYSYQFDFRKPNRRIFLEAASRLGIDPSEAIYVGDRLDADVAGARGAGMTPILKAAYTNAGKIVPNGTTKIDNIAELLNILKL